MEHMEGSFPMRFQTLFLAGLLSMQTVQAADAAAFAWPRGARAAVSLAYDDALDSQLDHALPVLDKYGIKASFYLTLSSPVVEKRMAAWRAAGHHGHELGNHSLFHQCSGKAVGHEWVQPHRDLDSTSAAQMRDQVLAANTMLMAIDGKSVRSFTVPCGDTLAGGTDYLPSIVPFMMAVKVSGPAVAPSMATLDPYAVPVFAPEGLSGKELIALVEAAAAQGTMVNLTFHGVGGDYLVTSSAAHEELVRYLAAHRDRFWTDTFMNIMRHVKARRAP
jgi:peptidoglycan/xylan/chitin deacetylase (PgdA/CDA1 family)